MCVCARSRVCVCVCLCLIRYDISRYTENILMLFIPFLKGVTLKFGYKKKKMTKMVIKMDLVH